MMWCQSANVQATFEQAIIESSSYTEWFTRALDIARVNDGTAGIDSSQESSTERENSGKEFQEDGTLSCVSLLTDQTEKLSNGNEDWNNEVIQTKLTSEEMAAKWLRSKVRQQTTLIQDSVIELSSLSTVQGLLETIPNSLLLHTATQESQASDYISHPLLHEAYCF